VVGRRNTRSIVTAPSVGHDAATPSRMGSAVDWSGSMVPATAIAMAGGVGTSAAVSSGAGAVGVETVTTGLSVGIVWVCGRADAGAAGPGAAATGCHAEASAACGSVPGCTSVAAVPAPAYCGRANGSIRPRFFTEGAGAGRGSLNHRAAPVPVGAA
jgi:hypothetical protein